MFFRVIYRKKYDRFTGIENVGLFYLLAYRKVKMSPKYRHEPEARGTQGKNYPSRCVPHYERQTKRVHKKD